MGLAVLCLCDPLAGQRVSDYSLKFRSVVVLEALDDFVVGCNGGMGLAVLCLCDSLAEQRLSDYNSDYSLEFRFVVLLETLDDFVPSRNGGVGLAVSYLRESLVERFYDELYPRFQYVTVLETLDLSACRVE